MTFKEAMARSILKRIRMNHAIVGDYITLKEIIDGIDDYIAITSEYDEMMKKIKEDK